MAQGQFKERPKQTLESLGLQQLKRPADKAEQNVSMLVQGPVGSGKTWLAQSMPDPTFIMADMNVGSLVEVERDPFYVTSWEEWVSKFQPAIDNRLLPGKSLILDTGDLSPYSAKVRMQIYAMGIADIEFDLPASFFMGKLSAIIE